MKCAEIEAVHVDKLDVYRFFVSMGHPGTHEGQFQRPMGLALGQEDRIYVADTGNHRVQVFSNDGKVIF